MKLLQHSYWLFIVASILFGPTSCSKDEEIALKESTQKDKFSNGDNNKGGQNEGGTKTTDNIGNFVVRGELNEEYKGEAIFSTYEANDAYQWYISIGDIQGEEDFTLSFTLMDMEKIGRPAVGEYVIGDWAQGSDVFLPNLAVMDTPVTWTQYTTLKEEAGKLIIEVSNEEEVSGTFKFTAHRYKVFDVIGTIEVEGEFSAIKTK